MCEEINHFEADLLSELFRKNVAWLSLEILGYSKNDVERLYRKVLDRFKLENL